jgi:hypothetical protein
MQSSPKLAKQIQQAVDRGQVVLIPAPAPPSEATAAPIPLPHNRSEGALTATFCMLFGLTRCESRMLVRLATQDYGDKNELRAAASAALGRPVTENSIQTMLAGLRKKLKSHGVRIATISGLGYGLDTATRSQLRALLVQHDAALRLEPEADPKPAA